METMATQNIIKKAHDIPGMSSRNFACAKYNNCLAQAAYSNKRSLPCARCKDMQEGQKIGDDLNSFPRVHRQVVSEDSGYIGSVDAAIMLGVTLSRRLYTMRLHGEGPEYVHDGKHGTPVKYEISALQRYITACANVPKEEPTEISTPNAATMLGISTGYLQKMRGLGTGPPWRKLGERFLYNVKELEEYKRNRNV